MMAPTYDYPRPLITVDTVVFDFTEEDNVPQVLLIQRGHEPFKGMWAIPGGFLEMDEELEEGAARELEEETNVDIPIRYLKQVCAVGRKNRDPRGRIVSVVYTVVVEREDHYICAGDDAEEVAWYRIDALPELAADHLEIVEKALGQHSW